MNAEILIVDDEKSVLMMLTALFKESGYHRIHTAEDYNSAVAAFTEHNFDMILCDIMLGEKTGINVLEELKKSKSDTPLVLMTGKPDVETAIMAVRLGAFDYLRKPVKVRPLMETVEKALKQKADTTERKSREREYKEKLNKEIHTYRMHLKNLDGQIQSAADVYRNLMNIDASRLPVGMTWRHKPLAELGGDFFDVWRTEDRLDLIVADVAGHDLASSFHTVLLKAFFEENCRKGNDGSTLFSLINQYLYDTGDNDRMITALFLRLHLKTGVAEIVSSAHPWIVMIRKDAHMPNYILEKGGDAIGIYQHLELMTTQVQTQPGDRIIIHTDGVANVSRLETISGIHRKLTSAEFESILSNHTYKYLDDMISAIWDDIQAFCENKPKDDLLLMGMEVK